MSRVTAPSQTADTLDALCDGQPAPRKELEWADIAEPGSLLARAAANEPIVVDNPDFAPDNSTTILSSRSSDPAKALADFRDAWERTLEWSSYAPLNKYRAHHRETAGFRDQLGRDLRGSDQPYLILFRGRKRALLRYDDISHVYTLTGELALGIRTKGGDQ